MIGDRKMDIDAGIAVGCRTILVTTGPSGGNGITNLADCTADSLIEAAGWIAKDAR
jgi:phosphoglycolate phosphatase-like HAD superfamily hydrolase